MRLETVLQRHRRAYERVALAALWGGAALTAGGAAAYAFAPAFGHHLLRAGVWAAAAGLLVTALANAMTYPLRTLATVAPEQSGGATYDLSLIHI